jgi:uncharacterized protein (DUF1684 family)
MRCALVRTARWRAPLGSLLFACAALAGCAEPWRDPPPIDAATFQAEHDAWREYRRAALTTPPSGPVLFIGLWALSAGPTVIGADSSLPVVLPAAKSPPLAARLVRAGSRIRLEPAPGTGFTLADGSALTGPIELNSDADSNPTGLHLGSLGMRIHRVGDRYWLRVWDEDSRSRKTFTGAPFFPVDLAWRVAAQLERFREPKAYRVADMVGGEQEYAAPGRLAFKVAGRTYRLTPFVEPGASDLWILFADSTNASETYPAGRYLLLPPPDSTGWTVIDFNRAYSPPCAFTAYATCPLPPPENRLPLAVAAGEKRLH